MPGSGPGARPLPGYVGVPSTIRAHLAPSPGTEDVTVGLALSPRTPLPVVDAFRTYFRSLGIAPSFDAASHSLVLRGPVAAQERAFSTSLAQWRSPGFPGEFAGSPPTLPAGLAPWVRLVGGLEGGLRAREDIARLPGTMDPASSGFLTPQDMEDAYNATSVYALGDLGQGETIGFAEMCDPTTPTSQYATDLHEFDAQFLSAYPYPNVTFVGSGAASCPSGDGYAGWNVETNLDMQWAHVIAPKANLVVCLDLYTPYNCDEEMVTQNISIISNSFTALEDEPALWSLAAQKGSTLFSAAGDYLAWPLQDPAYPAADPNGIDVGGTALSVTGSGSYRNESVWNGTCSGPYGPVACGTGGGCDPYNAPPPWQMNATGFPGPCTVREHGGPDVAMDASPATGVTIVVNGSAYSGYGGTSLSTPMWAAVLALLYRGTGAHPIFFAPTAYLLASTSSPSSPYHPITQGSNGYPATAGWDPATGLGTPNIGAMLDLLKGPPRVSVGVPAGPVETGSYVHVRATVSGAWAPLDVTWSVDGVVDPQAPNATRWTWVPATPGTYQISCHILDAEGASATSSSVSVTVVPGPSVSLRASPTFGDYRVPIELNASASGGSGSYAFYTWYANGTEIANTTTPTFRWDANLSGDYPLTVRVQDTAGGGATASVEVRINPPLSVLLDYFPSSVDTGIPVNLTAYRTGGAAPYVYQWTLNGSLLAQTTVPWVRWTPPGALPAHYDIGVGVRDALGSTASSPPLSLVAVSPPQFHLSLPSRDPVDVGFPSTVRGAVSGGTAPFLVTWSVDGSTVITGTDLNLTLTESNPGNYTVQGTLSDAEGAQANTTPVLLRVNPVPLTVVEGPRSVSVGQWATYRAGVSGGTPPFSISWQGTLPNGSLSGGGEDFSIRWNATGEFVVRLALTDSFGVAAPVAVAHVNVTPVVQNPLLSPLVPGIPLTLLDWMLLGVAAAAIAVVTLRRRSRGAFRSPPSNPPPASPGEPPRFSAP